MAGTERRAHHVAALVLQSAAALLLLLASLCLGAWGVAKKHDVVLSVLGFMSFGAGAVCWAVAQRIGRSVTARSSTLLVSDSTEINLL